MLQFYKFYLSTYNQCEVFVYKYLKCNINMLKYLKINQRTPLGNIFYRIQILFLMFIIVGIPRIL